MIYAFACYVLSSLKELWPLSEVGCSASRIFDLVQYRHSCFYGVMFFIN